MSNTAGSRPSLCRRSVSESESDPLNSTINPRCNIDMNFPPERSESNPNISGFIDESPYRGPGTWLQSRQEGYETNIEKIENFLFRLQLNINEWEESDKSNALFSLVEISNRFFALNADVYKLTKQADVAVFSNLISKDITNLSDTLLRAKQLGLRKASSRIDIHNCRPETGI